MFRLKQGKAKQVEDLEEVANELRISDIKRPMVVSNDATSDTSVSENVMEELERRNESGWFGRSTFKPEATSDSKTDEESLFCHQLTCENNKEKEDPHTCIKNAISGQRTQCIDIKSFSLVLLHKVGPKQALEIISSARLEHVPFTHDFYYKFILSSLLENHQRLVLHRTRTDTHNHSDTTEHRH